MNFTGMFNRLDAAQDKIRELETYHQVLSKMKHRQKEEKPKSRAQVPCRMTSNNAAYV